MHLIEKHAGVTFIAIQKATPALTFDAQLHFKVGSGYEPKKLAGISHFLEHAIFLGTKTRPSRREVELNLLSFGGTYNAATGVNSTSFSLSGALDRSRTAMEEGIRSLYDLGFEAALNNEREIEKEKKVVLSEIEQELTEGGEWSDQVQVAYETLYAGSVLEQSILGTKKSVKKIGMVDLKTYHDTYYHRDGACLTLVTPLPPKEAMKRVLKVAVPNVENKSGRQLPRMVHPNSDKSSKVKCIKAASYTWDLDFFFDFPKPKTVKESVALKLMTLILFHSELSVVFGEARKKGLVYMACGMPISFLDTCVYRIAANLAPAKADKFWKLLRKQLKNLWLNGIDAVFLEFCKAHFYYSRQVMLERYDMYAYKLVEKEFLGESTFLPEEEMAVLNGVTEADILNMVHHVFCSRRVVTIRGADLDKSDEVAMNKQGVFLEPVF